MNVYDLDNTIYKGDSTTDFFLYSLRKHRGIIKLLPGIIAGFVKFYIFKKGTKTQFKQRIMYFVRYIDYDKDIASFWDKKAGNIKAFYLEQQKDDDVIISASPYFVIEPVCRKLGIKHIICSPVNKKSGEYYGENCHGKEKVVRFFEEYPQGEIDKFYSDSYSDTPLAEIAKEAYMIKGQKISPWKFK